MQEGTHNPAESNPNVGESQLWKDVVERESDIVGRPASVWQDGSVGDRPLRAWTKGSNSQNDTHLHTHTGTE